MQLITAPSFLNPEIKCGLKDCCNFPSFQLKLFQFKKAVRVKYQLGAGSKRGPLREK